MNQAIGVQDLSHSFGGKIVLDHLDFQVEKGEIFGLLGPSGAGKTTLIRILTGQLKATAGSCAVLGVSSADMTGRQYRQIGMMMDHLGLYERMSCYDNLRFYQMLDGRKSRDIKALLEQVGLGEAGKTPVMNCSKGMKNRLAFARAILRRPTILFLDEPTSGLDPTTVEAIHKLILEEKQRGTTIFLTTHNMYEAEKLCDHIALLNHGKIVESGAPAQICRRYNHQRKIRIHLRDGQDVALAHTRECGEKLAAYFQSELVESIHSTEPNLETVFMELTGGKLAI